MTNLGRISKDYEDSGALHAQIGLQEAIDESTFLTKAGHLVTILRVDGVDDECLDSDQVGQISKRIESALRLLDEMLHDAAIYQVYQAEAARITEEGGQVRRITLDYELKRTVYSPLAKERPGSAEYKKRQAEIAADQGLKVVRGHIQLPDLRIEYQTRDGEITRTDLELATTHYRGGQLVAKAEAGFRFYASAEDQSLLSSVFDDHHITAEILSL